MQWYLVAYAHALRAEKARTETEAARQAFGLVDARRMTVRAIGGRRPGGMARWKLQGIEQELALRHFRRTGAVLSGHEKEPGICNVHWTECELCRLPILTEPKASGSDGGPCFECTQKLQAVPDEEVAALSTAALRQKLNIGIRSNGEGFLQRKHGESTFRIR